MFEAKIHRYSTPFSGDSAAAMDVGRIALLSQGFEIVSDTGSELHARGPGMHSNQQILIGSQKPDRLADHLAQSMIA